MRPCVKQGEFCNYSTGQWSRQALPLEMSASDYALGKVSFYAEHHGSCKVQKPFIPKKKSPDSILDYGILTYRTSENFIYSVYMKCA